MNQRPPVRPGYVPDPAVPLRLCADEMWSFVGRKRTPCWLWWVEEVGTGRVLAFVFGRRTHATFRRLRAVLARAGWRVEHWLTDAWWAYVDELDPAEHSVGKAPLQALERKHLTLRTRLKRLARKTLCFSKKWFFHQGLIALFIFHFFFSIQQS